MTGGQAIVKQLQAEGVDTLFGIIGNSTFALYDALYEEPGIPATTPRATSWGPPAWPTAMPE